MNCSGILKTYIFLIKEAKKSEDNFKISYDFPQQNSNYLMDKIRNNNNLNNFEFKYKDKITECFDNLNKNINKLLSEM